MKCSSTDRIYRTLFDMLQWLSDTSNWSCIRESLLFWRVVPLMFLPPSVAEQKFSIGFRTISLDFVCSMRWVNTTNNSTSHFCLVTLSSLSTLSSLTRWSNTCSRLSLLRSSCSFACWPSLWSSSLSSIKALLHLFSSGAMREWWTIFIDDPQVFSYLSQEPSSNSCLTLGSVPIESCLRFHLPTLQWPDSTSSIRCRWRKIATR